MTAGNPAERLLSPAEAAAELKVARAALIRMAARGKLAAIRTIGGHRRYRESDVRALREEREARSRMLTTTAVAALFGVDRKTVGRWVKAGRLAPVPGRGNQYLFRPEEVCPPPERGEGGGP